MDIKFTTKSQDVISAANTNAQTAGNPTIETSHILKALMDQREGIAVSVLKAAGLNVDSPPCRPHRPAHRASGTPTSPPK